MSPSDAGKSLQPVALPPLLLKGSFFESKAHLDCISSLTAYLFSQFNTPSFIAKALQQLSKIHTEKIFAVEEINML